MERNNLQKGPSFHFHGSSKQRALVDLEASKEEAVRNVYLSDFLYTLTVRSCCSNLDGKGSQKICRWSSNYQDDIWHSHFILQPPSLHDT
jgi:hypothetical protein